MRYTRFSFLFFGRSSSTSESVAETAFSSSSDSSLSSSSSESFHQSFFFLVSSSVWIPAFYTVIQFVLQTTLLYCLAISLFAFRVVASRNPSAPKPSPSGRFYASFASAQTCYFCGNRLCNSLTILSQSALKAEFSHEFLSKASSVLFVRFLRKNKPAAMPRYWKGAVSPPSSLVAPSSQIRAFHSSWQSFCASLNILDNQE